MKVTFDWKRVLHLVLLIVLTITFGQLLVQRYEWKPLSAYGLTCSVVCQISNVILKFHEVSGVIAEKNRNDDSRTRKKMKKTKIKTRRVKQG
jgi:hypothetical protein